MPPLSTQQNSRLCTLSVSLFLATTVAIVLYTLYAAFHYSSNAMLSKDEASFVILSTEKILAATNLSELIGGLFPSHGQHLLLGMQLVNLFTYFTFGVLDRRIMNVIGVAILCIAALLLPGKTCKNRYERILIYASLFPLILSPAHNSCIVNASCTGNHYMGIALSVCSLYFFTKITEKKYFFICAEAFMLLAIFSLPASIALIPISIYILATTPDVNKNWLLGFHFLLIILTLAFHSMLSYPDTIFSFAQSTDPVSSPDLLEQCRLFSVTFFIIVGSMFFWLHDMGYSWILIVIGVIFTMTFAAVFLKNYKFITNSSLSFQMYGAILFITMIFIISFGRYYSLGSSRYASYTAFLYVMFLLVLYYRLDQSTDAQQTMRRIKILTATSSLSLIYFLTALHYHQPYLTSLEKKDQICKQLWKTEGYACGVMIHHEEATRIIKSAIDQGIYKVEE